MMKLLRYLDFGVQTFLIGAVAFLSLAVVLMGDVETVGLIAMYGAIFIGPWQMVSSLSTVIARRSYFKWRLTHLLVSIVYIVGLSVTAAFFSDTKIEGLLKYFLWTLGFGTPVILALFYYYITYKSVKLARTQPNAGMATQP